jgi:Zn-finger nucleic acid-binding protein
MRTYERNGVHIDQCGTCRGIFLDVGELEALTRLEAQLAAPAPQPYPQQQYAQQPPPGHYGPGWGSHGQQHYRKGGFARLFFSS